MLHFLDFMYTLQSKRSAMWQRALVHSIWITQSYYSSPKCKDDLNKYIIQFNDFSKTSYYDLEHRLPIMLDNLSPVSNSISALWEFWIWSDA